MMDLSEGHKVLLETIHEHDKPSTSDIKTDDTVADHYNPASVGKTLRRLASGGYIQIDRGRPNRYELTEDGYNIVKHRRDKRKRRLKEAAQQDDELPFSDAVEKFESYFTIDEIEQELVDRSLNAETAVIDYRHLERIEPPLADHVLDDPEKLIEAAETAIRKLSVIENQLDVRFTDLPDYRQKHIREISAADIGKLVTVPGIVLKASKTKPTLVSATFECTACGDRSNKKQEGAKLKSPFKCDCGNKTFETVEKEFDDARILKLQEKPDSPDKKMIKVRVFGSMANEQVITEMKPGTPVQLTGVVKAEEPSGRNKTYHDLYIEAIDVEEEQNKWEEIELTDADRERNQEIVEYGPVEAFQDSLAVDRVIHRDLMKEAFLLFLLGKTEDEGNLHVLVMGEPGTGKSQLNTWAEEHFPKTVKAVAQSATGVGLTATVKEDKDFGGYVAQGGSLTLADGGYHITDEFDKVNPEDVSNFNEALASGTITLNKGDITNLKLDAYVSEWATANPREYDYFDPNTPKYKQIPVPPKFEATKDRFDVIIGIETYTSESTEKADVARHILRRNSDDFKDAQPEFAPEELVKFVTEASRLSPPITDEAEEMIFNAFFSLKEVEAETHRLITNRKLYALKKLAIAYARAHLAEEVTAEHAEMAFNFFKRSLESIDFEIGKDSFTEVNPKTKTDKRKVKDAVQELEQSRSEDAASIDAVIEETGLAGDRVELILKDDSEFYSPKQGLWKVT